MSDTEEVKLARLEESRLFMAKEIAEIKSDVKELRKDFDLFRTEMKVTMTKLTVAISILGAIAQVVAKYFFN